MSFQVSYVVVQLK